MKKIAALLFLSAVFAAPVFAADDEGIYVGVDVGSAHANFPSNYIGQVTSSISPTSGALIGYQFDKYWGFEGQYTSAGEVDTVNGANTTKIKSEIYTLDFVFNYPLSDAFSLYGKAGYGYNTTKVDSTTSNYVGTERDLKTYGLGGQFKVFSNMGIRFGWDSYFAAFGDTSGNVYKYNMDVYSLAAIFKF